MNNTDEKNHMGAAQIQIGQQVLPEKVVRKRNTRGKLGKKSIGSGRTNEVGDDIGKPVSVPLSMHDAVKAFSRIKRGKCPCPQLYAAVVIDELQAVFSASMGVPAVISPERSVIIRYLKELLERCYLSQSQHTVKISEDQIDLLEEVVEKLEYSFSDKAFTRLIRDKLEFIESLEKTLK